MPIKKIRKISFESYEIAKALERTSANDNEEEDMRLAIELSKKVSFESYDIAKARENDDEEEDMRLAIELSNMSIKKIRKKVSFESYDIAKARENEEEQMRLAIELSNTYQTEADEHDEAVRLSCIVIDDYWTSKTPEYSLHRSRYEAAWKNTDCSCNRCCWIRMCWITYAEQPQSFDKIALYNNNCTTMINQWRTDVILNLVKV